MRYEHNLTTGEVIELPDLPPIELTPEEVEAARVASIRAQIAAIEANITPRRLREAVLGDGGWLADKDAEIAALRAQL